MLHKHLSINTQTREFKSFMKVLFLMLFAIAAPQLAMAGTFNGNFGPDVDTVTNTNTSLQGWWRAIASWGLWLSLAAFFISVIFMGGRWWYIPIIVILICLFGEKAITQVATWGNLNGTGK